MIFGNNVQSIDGFVVPGTITISMRALQLAKEFWGVLKGSQGKDWVVTFDWAESVSVRNSPSDEPRAIGACLSLGAYERHEVPQGVTETIGGIELAIKIPREVWQESARRLIDFDENAFFKVVLR